MKMLRQFTFLTMISLAVLLAACTGQTPDNSTKNLSLASVEATSPEQTAEWLKDPESVDRGVWSLLKNLGLGVYTQEGDQILSGSERSSADLFLFDFEVALLLDRGQETVRPFSDYHQMLVPYGLQLTEEELKDFYRSAYDAHPDLWLVQLFQSMGLEFEGDVQLTPLQEWLLFLDTFVPPTGMESMTTAPKVLMDPVTISPTIQDGPCDAVRGGNADPGWGAAWQIGGFASDAIEGATLGPMSFLDPKDLLHAIMMYMGVKTEIQASSPTAHEGHEGDGDSVTFTVSVEFTGEFPEEIVSCATILGFDVPPSGPMEGVRVEWELDDVFTQHGATHKGGGVMFTDSAGKSEVVWVARHEPSGGEGDAAATDGTIEAVVRIQHGDVFNIFAGMQEFILPRTEAVTVNVGWHESSWILIMSMDAKLGESFINFSWDGLFIVDENNKLDGEGNVTITGSTGPCQVHENNVLTHEGPPGDIDGTFPFKIGGKQAVKIHAQVFDFKISSKEVSVDIQPKDEMCAFLYDFIEAYIDLIGSQIQDLVPLRLIEIQAKSGKTTTINIPEMGELVVTVLSSGG